MLSPDSQPELCQSTKSNVLISKQLQTIHDGNGGHESRCLFCGGGIDPDARGDWRSVEAFHEDYEGNGIFDGEYIHGVCDDIRADRTNNLWPGTPPQNNEWCESFTNPGTMEPSTPSPVHVVDLTGSDTDEDAGFTTPRTFNVSYSTAGGLPGTMADGTGRLWPRVDAGDGVSTKLSF